MLRIRARDEALDPAEDEFSAGVEDVVGRRGGWRGRRMAFLWRSGAEKGRRNMTQGARAL